MSDRIRGVSRINGLLVYNGKILPPGPWQTEPDHVEFEHEGLACILHRNAGWCGYVAVPPGHPWHGKSYDGDDAINPDVHGGITYGGECAGSICHIAKPGEPDDVWWVGFDCNHHLDLALWDLADMKGRTERLDCAEFNWVARYRDLAFVRAETEKLAEQAKAVAL